MIASSLLTRTTMARTRYTVKRSLLLVATAAVLCLIVLPRTASSREVIILKEADIKPYRDAVRGFKAACGCTATEPDPADNDRAAIRSTKTDVILAVGTGALKSAVSASGIPVVYTMVMPSVAASHAARNVSGVSMDIAPDDYFTAMTTLFPGVKRIGVLYDPRHTGPYVEQAAAAARARGLTLVARTVERAGQVPSLLAELRGAIDLFWMLPDSTVVNSESIDYLMLYSFQNKVPVFTFAKKFVDMGAVAALTIDPYDLGRQAGGLARRLLHGERGPLRPFAQNPRLIVNRKVIDKLGIRTDNNAIRKAERAE